MKFDPVKVNSTAPDAGYRVKYYIFNREDDRVDLSEQDIENLIDNSKNISCFANLKYMIPEYIEKYSVYPNRLLFKCNFEHHGEKKVHLSLEERIDWVNLCKLNKFLPDYVDEYFANTGNFVLKIENYTLPMTYIYLCMARYIQETPQFVRAVLHMVQEKGLGFLTAFSVASKFCIRNTGHHVIQLCRNYGNTAIVSYASYDLSESAKLFHYINQPNPKDTLKDMIERWKKGDKNHKLNIPNFSLYEKLACVKKSYTVKEEVIEENPEKVEDTLRCKAK